MSGMDCERFVEVVPVSSLEEADARFGTWLENIGLARDQVDNEDIRIDTIRALDGTSRRRYLVRERLISQRD